MVKCPFCWEEILDEAIKCKHCASNLATKDAKLKIRIQRQKTERLELEAEIKQRGFPKEVEKKLLNETFVYKKIRGDSDLEITNAVHEKIRKSKITVTYWLGFIAMSIGLSVRSPVFDVLAFSMVLAIWFHPEAYGDWLKEMVARMKSFKKYPARLGFSLFAAFMAYASVAWWYEAEIKKEDEAIQEQKRVEEERLRTEEDRKLYSEPIITVRSLQWMQPTAKYMLAFSVTGAQAVTVNGEVVTWSGGDYQENVEITAPTLDISIVARNRYYSKTETVSVSRKKTAEDIQAERIAEAEKLRKEAMARVEAKKAEVSKMFSSWDWSYHPLVEAVKQSMNDPDSFEHDSTTWSIIEDPKGGDKVRIRMNYRGKNAFGAVVRWSVLMELNRKTEELKIIE